MPLSVRPSFRVDGVESAVLANKLKNFVITQRNSEPCCCEAHFDNWGGTVATTGFTLLDRTLLDFGREFTIDVNDVIIFSGKIYGLDANFPDGSPPSIAVQAIDRLQDLRMQRRTRNFQDVSLMDIVQRIAGDHGLTAQCSVRDTTYNTVAQLNQTDFEFLSGRAAAAGALLWIEGQQLHVSLARDQGGTIPILSLGSSLRSFASTIDLTTQVTDLTVSGWDVSDKNSIAANVNASILLGDGISGPQLLEQSFGRRVETVVSRVPASISEARELATSLFKRSAQKLVRVTGVADFNEHLMFGKQVNILGVSTLLEGSYQLTEVTHRFDGMVGLRTEITAERAYIGN